MNQHKNNLSGASTAALLARRRRVAARLGDVEQVLAEVSAINTELLTRRELG